MKKLLIAFTLVFILGTGIYIISFNLNRNFKQPPPKKVIREIDRITNYMLTKKPTKVKDTMAFFMVPPPHSPFPSERMLKAYALFADILVIGPRWSKNTFGIPYVPKNEKAFRAMIATAHKYGLKVVPFTSGILVDSDLDNPYVKIKRYYPKYLDLKAADIANVELPEWRAQYISEVKRLLKTYDLDGIYVDGVWYKNDAKSSREFIKELRKAIGDKIFVLHSSNWVTPDLKAADIIFIGEHQQNFPRATLRQWNTMFGGKQVAIALTYTLTKDFANRLLSYKNLRLPLMAGVYYYPGHQKYFYKPKEIDIFTNYLRRYAEKYGNNR